MSTYRPTVRYAPVFRNYIDNAFQATHLDRNQIIRLALFVAAHSQEFNSILSDYQKKDVPLPCPLWSLSDHGWWMEQSPTIEREGGDVNVESAGRTTTQNDSSNVEQRSVLPPNVSPAAVSAKTGRITPVERFAGQIPPQRPQPDGRIQVRKEGGITIKLG